MTPHHVNPAGLVARLGRGNPLDAGGCDLRAAAETSHRIAEVRAREEGARAAAKGAELAKRPLVSASASYYRTNHVEEFSFPQPDGTFFVAYPDIPNNLVSRGQFSVADLHLGTV